MPYAGEKIRINEILPNPSGDESINEYIELYNPNTKSVNLHGWVLGDKSITGRYTFPASVAVPPQGFLLLRRPTFGFALNNNGDSVTLWASRGDEYVVVDHLHYTRSAPEDVSLNYERSGVYRWSKTLTPGARNIFNMLPIIDVLEYDDEIYKDVTAHFAVRAHDLDGEALSYRWDFGDGHRSYKASTTHTYDAQGHYTVQVRVKDASEEVMRQFSVDVHRYPHRKIKIVAIAPNPRGKDTGTEYVVIKNKSKKSVNLRGWSIVTGSTKNKSVNHPLHKKIVLAPGKEKKIYTKYSAITLPNRGGYVAVRRPDGTIAYSKKYTPPSGYKTVPDDAVYRKRAHADGGGWVWDVPHVAEKEVKQTQVDSGGSGDERARAISARAWENEFGTHTKQSNMYSKDAPAPRATSVHDTWYRRAMAWFNALFAHTVQMIAVYMRSEKVNTYDEMYVIDRTHLADVSIHPAVIALSLTGLNEQSVKDALKMQRR